MRLLERVDDTCRFDGIAQPADVNPITVRGLALLRSLFGIEPPLAQEPRRCRYAFRCVERAHRETSRWACRCCLKRRLRFTCRLARQHEPRQLLDGVRRIRRWRRVHPSRPYEIDEIG